MNCGNCGKTVGTIDENGHVDEDQEYSVCETCDALACNTCLETEFWSDQPNVCNDCANQITG